MHRKNFILFILPALLLLPGNFTVLATTQSPETTGLRQSILALDSAWSTALKDLQQKKQDHVLQESERKDYAKFITFLGTRINEYCQQLRENGDPSATVDLPCPDSGSTGSGLSKKEPASSSSEQVAALDKSLSEALGGFDELLLKEEERLAQRMPRQRESGQGYGGSQGRGAGGQNGSGNSSGQTASGSQNGNRGSGQEQGSSGIKTDGSRDGQGSQASGGTGAGAGSGQTDDGGQQGGMTEIESGYDDIVARQLREAAEKEIDPELKEKLWEEYRKYKKGVL